jgi:hypothetical protein
MAIFKYDRFLSFMEITQALREAEAIKEDHEVKSFGEVAALCGKKLGRIVNVNSFQDASMAIREAFGAEVVGIDDPDYARGDGYIQAGNALR